MACIKRLSSHEITKRPLLQTRKVKSNNFKFILRILLNTDLSILYYPKLLCSIVRNNSKFVLSPSWCNIPNMSLNSALYIYKSEFI